MDSRFQIFGAKTTPDIRSGFLGIVIGPETILPDMSGGPTDFREDCQGSNQGPFSGVISRYFCMKLHTNSRSEKKISVRIFLISRCKVSSSHMPSISRHSDYST